MRSAAAALVLAGLVASPTRAQTLTPAERRGREIYRRGTGAEGLAVPARLNGEPSEAPLACASCHGRDGRGRPEGGLLPADVRWQTLSRGRAATGVLTARPAYDLRHLLRAVTMGLDAAGRRLDPLMPRYLLQRAEADDLLAFLARLGTLADPGLTPEAFRVGVLLPPGPQAAAARVGVEAWAAGLAARGGIYARRPEPVFFASGAELAGLDEPHEPFVLLGTPDGGAFEDVAAWAVRREAPWIVSRPSDSVPPLDRWIAVLGRAPHGEPPAVAALAPLERALQRIGREATRERLVEALEDGR